jgi:hypothetical protein
MIGCRYFRDATQRQTLTRGFGHPLTSKRYHSGRGAQLKSGVYGSKSRDAQMSAQCSDARLTRLSKTIPFIERGVHRRKRHFHAVSRFAATLSHANKRNFPPPISPSQPAMRCDGPKSTDLDDVKGGSDNYRWGCLLTPPPPPTSIRHQAL